MLVSPRRGIVYPNTTRVDSADVPRDIAALVAALEVDVTYGQGTLAARPVSTPGSPGLQGRIYEATDTVPKSFYWDNGTGWDSIGGSAAAGADLASGTSISTSAPIHRITGTTTIDTITDAATFTGKSLKLIFQGATICVRHNGGGTGNIRLNGGVAAGFVAGEILNLTFDGTNWVEDSRTPRHLSGQGGIIYGGSATPTGLLAEDGSAVSATTYAALSANLGTLYGTSGGNVVLPDSRGRVDVGFVPSGGHTDVSTIGLTDGVTLASRRPKHKHTVVQPTISAPTIDINTTASSNGPTAVSGRDVAANTSIPALNTPPVATGGTVGPQSGAEPIDAPAYIVRPKFTRI